MANVAYLTSVGVTWPDSIALEMSPVAMIIPAVTTPRAFEPAGSVTSAGSVTVEELEVSSSVEVVTLDDGMSETSTEEHPASMVAATSKTLAALKDFWVRLILFLSFSRHRRRENHLWMNPCRSGPSHRLYRHLYHRLGRRCGHRFGYRKS